MQFSLNTHERSNQQSAYKVKTELKRCREYKTKAWATRVVQSLHVSHQKLRDLVMFSWGVNPSPRWKHSTKSKDDSRVIQSGCSTSVDHAMSDSVSHWRFRTVIRLTAVGYDWEILYKIP